MKVKTQDLKGAALDWAVAQVCYPNVTYTKPMDGSAQVIRLGGLGGVYSPSTDWSQCGLLIERKGVWLSDDATDEPQGPWIASVGGGYMQYGSTPLVAACRAIVSAKLGDEVDVPEELV